MNTLAILFGFLSMVVMVIYSQPTVQLQTASLSISLKKILLALQQGNYPLLIRTLKQVSNSHHELLVCCLLVVLAYFFRHQLLIVLDTLRVTSLLDKLGIYSNTQLPSIEQLQEDLSDLPQLIPSSPSPDKDKASPATPNKHNKPFRKYFLDIYSKRVIIEQAAAKHQVDGTFDSDNKEQLQDSVDPAEADSNSVSNMPDHNDNSSVSSDSDDEGRTGLTPPPFLIQHYSVEKSVK